MKQSWGCLNIDVRKQCLLNNESGIWFFSLNYRDFKNKLQKVDGDFRPFRSSGIHEILCLVIIRVRFLKIENKNLVIEVVEEL